MLKKFYGGFSAEKLERMERGCDYDVRRVHLYAWVDRAVRVFCERKNFEFNAGLNMLISIVLEDFGYFKGDFDLHQIEERTPLNPATAPRPEHELGPNILPFLLDGKR